MKSGLAATVVSLLVFADLGHAASIDSTFDGGRDGWTVADLVQPLNGLPAVDSILIPAHTGSGGNPGGAISQTDLSANAWYFSAPAKFLGNRSTNLFGNLSWDFALNQPSGIGTFEELILTDGVTALYYLDTGPASANAWRRYSVNLVGASFHVGSGNGPFAKDNQLGEVLSNLTALYILGDWVSGTETGILDNVRLVSPPSISIVPATTNGVVLLWSDTNVVVEATSDLTPPITWESVTNEVHVASDKISMIIQTDKPKRFFRLRALIP